MDRFSTLKVKHCSVYSISVSLCVIYLFKTLFKLLIFSCFHDLFIPSSLRNTRTILNINIWYFFSKSEVRIFKSLRCYKIYQREKI